MCSSSVLPPAEMPSNPAGEATKQDQPTSDEVDDGTPVADPVATNDTQFHTANGTLVGPGSKELFVYLVDYFDLISPEERDNMIATFEVDGFGRWVISQDDMPVDLAWQQGRWVRFFLANFSW